MFPNPQEALPLPPRPNLERYKKIAKDLIKACESGDPEVVRGWAEEWVGDLVKLSGLAITPQLPVRMERWIDEVSDFARRKLFGGDSESRKCALAGAQFVIARSHGFESWPKFIKHLQALARNSSLVCRFEAAADAIVNGEIATLKRLLREEPELIRARSPREHGAMLLHYVSANGIEGYRQKTPDNIVEIAGILLGAGADVDATANVYGGGCTTLGLTATSIHPKRAGVQEALLRTLLEHGARLNLAEAAAMGHLDVVETFFAEDGSLRPSATPEQVQEGFFYACEYGRNRVVEFLIEKGVDVAGQDRNGQTGLHRAAIGGHAETVDLLLKHKAPLEATNIYGGTVLGQALWSAAHESDSDRYIAVLEALAAAGARLPEHPVPVNKSIDEWLKRRLFAAASAASTLD